MFREKQTHIIRSIHRRKSHSLRGGGIEEALLPYAQRHPIILPRNNHVTDIIIQYYHTETNHAGTQTTLY